MKPFVDLTQLKIRDEGTGIHTVFNKETGNVLAANCVAHQIMLLCNGRRTSGEICSKMQELYPEVSEVEIAADVESCLVDLQRKGVVNVLPSKAGPGERPQVRIATDDDAVAISRFLSEIHKMRSSKGDNGFLYALLPLPAYAAAGELRSRIFHGLEIFSILSRGNHVMGVASSFCPSIRLEAPRLCLFALGSEDLSEALTVELLDKLRDILARNSIHKLRCDQHDIEKNDIFFAFLQRNGFRPEATLRGESQSGHDVIVWSQMLSPIHEQNGKQE
ncbi:PqqD family protein [Candidatus Zixiibacteriota bacterium]